ncbi:MAG: hypothetical protein AAB325_05545 [Pseudomonadota bacterium]
MFALVVSVAYRPVAAQMLGLYAGGTKIRDATHDRSHAWGLDYMEQVAPHFGFSLLYLNEGHPSDHRRDGFGMQAWARTSSLGGRLTLAAGVGPYYYFNTSRRGQADYANEHGLGLIYSLGAAMQVADRWSLLLRLNRVDARKQSDTNVVLLGIGYQLDGAPARSSATASYTAARPNEVTVFAGQTIVNSFESESERGLASGIEYRRAFSRHVEWTAGFLNESGGHVLRRKGIASQGWLTQWAQDDRISFGIGLGPYLAVDRRDAGQADKRDRLAGMVSLSARYRFTPQWHARVTWNRVLTDYDRDADVLLVGAGYTF